MVTKNEQKINKPQFAKKIEKRIINFKTGEYYKLLGGLEISLSEKDIISIQETCSQKEIYNILFKLRFHDKPYTLEDANLFVKYVQEGWKNSTHFVFLIRNTENKIVGAIDIKSPDLDRAEVGYWADVNSRGFMTNALTEICSIAKKAKYKKLFAEVRPDNYKSAAVLQRVGFVEVGTNEREYNKGVRYRVFELNLETEKILTKRIKILELLQIKFRHAFFSSHSW